MTKFAYRLSEFFKSVLLMEQKHSCRRKLFLYRAKVFGQLELEQAGKESAIEEIVRKVIEGNSKSFEAYKADKDKTLGFLEGQSIKSLAARMLLR